jgi:DNA helicase HerA-like ATPase
MVITTEHIALKGIAMATPQGDGAMQVTDWRAVGTVVGNAGTSEFTFILKQFQARIGDIVALSMDVPSGQAAERKRIYVWARITDINRFNPFFPFEAGQELAAEGISLESTVLANTRDQLEATALILGATSDNNLSALFPLTYPVKPATTIYHPPTQAVRQLLVGDQGESRRIRIGSLIAREDVDVTLSAQKMVARHLAILAMTGGGKTVAARRIIRELIGQGYPLLIIDPHGDYIGLSQCEELLKADNPDCTVRLFYPELLIEREGEELISRIISQMTSGMTEPQNEYLRALYGRLRANEGERALDYLTRLLGEVGRDLAGNRPPPGTTQRGNWQPTVYVVRRNLNIVHDRLERMARTSEQMRRSPKLRHLPFESLPNPFGDPAGIIQPNQVSILYLAGYDLITQCSIVAITLETLFNFRSSLSGRIPPFFTVLEEAHTFIPSAREGTEDAVSLPVVRRVITEGRKFGTGLMLISQRPSRLDGTIVSQCNSFLILRLVNPKDQTFVRAIMENLTDSDARMLPGFGPGQGIVSGQVVRFPLAVKVQMDDELRLAEIGDEDFFEQLESWSPDEAAPLRQEIAESMGRVRQARRKKKKKRRD